ATCGSKYQESTIDGITTTVFQRGCTDPAQCNAKSSLTLQNGHISIALSCCGTDSCTPTIPQLPPKSSTPNGVVCRACRSETSSWCYTSDTLQCTGEENMCFLQTEEVTGGVSSSEAFRGCGTKSHCDFGNSLEKNHGSLIKVSVFCTNDGISVYKAIIAPVITCLLLLKLFF
ncbi:phospholipase A2 inhibitor and Ly6/PLAUR domain-containing protein-like, partial [Dendropsophus ebraccatus]|uniref:phospholipase A2 inhibitor and Ly6/PLAUR domain-containing protein-like n=1 Tax=Dendropsophus ebraccatus TaxID=150705 RepID=UPI003831A43E